MIMKTPLLSLALSCLCRDYFDVKGATEHGWVVESGPMGTLLSACNGAGNWTFCAPVLKCCTCERVLRVECQPTISNPRCCRCFDWNVTECHRTDKWFAPPERTNIRSANFSVCIVDICWSVFTSYYDYVLTMPPNNLLISICRLNKRSSQGELAWSVIKTSFYDFSVGQDKWVVFIE